MIKTITIPNIKNKVKFNNAIVQLKYYVKLRHRQKEGFLFYVSRRREEPAQKLVDF